MQSQKGKLFLIPAPLNENEECLSEMQKKSICLLQNFIVENAKPARQALKKIGLKNSLQELNIIENNKNCEFDYQFTTEKILVFYPIAAFLVLLTLDQILSLIVIKIIFKSIQ
jgi:hypothetical protein